LGEESTRVKIFLKISSLKGFFFDVGVVMNLKNEEVLLSGIGRVNEFFFFKELFLGWGKKGVFPFFSLFFLSHNMVT
jgi:hypothetical protein